MKIYRALKTNKISQKFGQNLYPGYVLNGMLGHNGIDFDCPDGEPVYWDCDIEGKVASCFVDMNTGAIGGGKGVIVFTEDKDGAFNHRFWHLQGFACKADQILKSGDLLGYAGHTGTVTAPHLHRDIKPLAKDQYGIWRNVYPNNGYHGCIDFTPYFTNIFIRDIVQISALQKLIEIIKELLSRK